MSISISQANNFSYLPNPFIEYKAQPDSTQDAMHNQWTAPATASSRSKRATSQGSEATWYSDKKLLQEVKKHFHEYARGADDKYVNFNELKEAAGELQTDRVFSEQASDVAKVMLARKDLLNRLDIGIGFFGPGLQDERFDHENLDYLIRYASNTPRPRFSDDDE